ncbi:MAG: GGDEF domain-containing response regulator [Actinomycetota bacterium]
MGSSGLVLVADDDEDIVRFVEVNLRLEGFDVTIAVDGEAALKSALELHPDLALLDVMMPKLDGYEVCQALRNDARTKHMSIIMLTAKALSADKVVGLTVGADDYIIKPFDPIELVARVKSALRRSREMRDLNPLTELPGNVQVQNEVARKVASGDQFAVLYIDLDNFKAFNDHYGFLRGDEAIKLLARCISEAMQHCDGADCFLGHVGGDDFLAVVPSEIGEATAKEVIACWDQEIRSLYDSEDIERGYVEVPDRLKKLHRYPIMTVSVGVATNAHRAITSHWEAAEIATEMKHFAKQDAKSSYAVDRRRKRGPPQPE